MMDPSPNSALETIHALFTIGNCLRYGPSIFALIAVFGALVYKRAKIDIGPLLISAVAGSSIPTGLVLLMAPFNRNAVEGLSQGGFGLYLLFAGIALLYVAYTSIQEVLQK